jgi:hypothetical protein
MLLPDVCSLSAGSRFVDQLGFDGENEKGGFAMRTAKIRERTLCIMCLLVLSLALGLGASEAWAQGCWTTVGSAGSVDEQDLNIFTVATSIIGIKTTVGQGVLDLYYNVVDEEKLHGGKKTRMTVRYLDNDAASQVVIRLRSVDIATGVEAAIVLFDSNAFPPLGGFQTQSVSVAVPEFDFTTKAYYLLVKISKAGTAGNPQLQAVRICRE